MGRSATQIAITGNKIIQSRNVYFYSEEEWIATFPKKNYCTLAVMKQYPINENLIEGLLTEDGYVIPVWDLKYRNGRLMRFYCPLGKIETNTNLKIYSYEMTTIDKSSKQLTRSDTLFIHEYLRSADLALAYKTAFNVNTMETAKAYRFGRKVLNKEKVRDYLKKEFSEAATSLGMDEHWLMEQWKNKVEDENGKISLEALKEVTEIFGAKEGKTNRNINLSLPLSQDDLRQLEGEKQKMLEDGNLVEFEVIDG